MRNDLAIKTVPLDELHNAPWNANRVPDDVLAKIRHSIVEFGVVENLVARERDQGGYEVISGNHRLGVYRDLGMKKASVHVVTLDDAKARVLAQVLNRTRGQDDAEEYAALLTDVLAEMSTDDVLSYLPESEKSLSQALDAMRLEDDAAADDVPPLPDKPESKIGEVYELGPHRLVCGDAREVSTLERLLGDDRVDCVWCDPPYGVAIASRIGTKGISSTEARAKGHEGIANDDLNVDQLTQFLRESLGAALTFTVPGGAWYIAAPHGPIGIAFSLVLTELGVWRHSLVWVKDRLVLGRADYHYQHEPLYYGWAPGGPHIWYGDRKQTTVLEYPRPLRNAEHPTMKPVALVEDCIRNSTQREGIVLDPFGGSGSTLIAADRLGRRARLVELDPRYCDVIRQRYEQAHA
jgi:DNA modification methylase